MKWMTKKAWITGSLVGALSLLTGAVALAAIGFDDAKRIALERVAGEVESIELERGVFEVEVRTPQGAEYEVYIDAERGTVIRVELDD